MDLKLLASTLLMVWILDISVDGHCDICSSINPFRDRVNCGHKGITKQECEDKRCCFDKTYWRTFWCFEKTIRYLKSTVAPERCEYSLTHPNTRSECGWRKMTRDMCVCRGCCWDDTIPRKLFCFPPTE